MRINADFSKRAVVTVDDARYVRSPESGVERLMLDRIGDEVARATSIVRYAPGSSFAQHVHDRGEEFLVLDGVFSDEHGHYSAGCYVRNPPGTRHSPYSESGCRIFVKLRQFDASDLAPVVSKADDGLAWEASDGLPGEQSVLHRFGGETVRLFKMAAGTRTKFIAPAGGLESLLLAGEAELDGRRTGLETWFRLPASDSISFDAIGDCLLWQKFGHLPPDSGLSGG